MGKRKSILLADSEPEQRRLYRITLIFEGFDVYAAGDGLEALRLLEQGPPDLVILDFDLPKIDVLSVQQEVAAHAFTRHIPVVLITAHDADLGGVEGRCVLRKPVAPEELVRAVRRCLMSGVPGVGL